MSFWLKDYAKMLEKIEYLRFKLTDPHLTIDDEENTKLELENCLSRKGQFEHLLKKFRSIEQKILYEKYVEGKTLVQISIELGYSDSYIKKRHAEVVRIIKMMST